MMNSSESVGFPNELQDRLRQIVPAAHFEQVWRSFHEPKWTCFRVNLLRAEREHVLSRLTQESVVFESLNEMADVYAVKPDQRESLIESACFRESQIYVQNPSSILAVRALAVQPHQEVLDLAAAPGGKSLLLAQQMQNTGRLAVVESVRGRFFQLRANLERYGATNVKTYLADGRTIGKKTPERFDHVLLDAPCSGESRFHQSAPDSFGA
jgi:16S rRNA C967 or C1407 C5-methylase (RsmB/RsmF family)